MPSYVIKEADELGDLPIGRCQSLMGRLQQLSGKMCRWPSLCTYAILTRLFSLIKGLCGF